MYYEKGAVLKCRLGGKIEVGSMVAVATDNSYYGKGGKIRIGIVVKINWRYAYRHNRHLGEEKYLPSIRLHNPKWGADRTYYTPENIIVLSQHSIDLDKVGE